MSNVNTETIQDANGNSYRISATYNGPSLDWSVNAYGRGRGVSVKLEVIIEFTDYFGGVSLATPRNVKALVYEWLKANSLTSVGIDDEVLYLSKINVSPHSAGTGIWKADCEFSAQASEGSSEFILANFSFSTIGRNVRIVDSLNTRSSLACVSDWTVLNFNRKIGMNSDGECEGVDVIRPTLCVNQDIFVPYSKFNMGVLCNYASRSCCVNATPFYGMNPGEALFKGLSQVTQSTISAGDSRIYYWTLSLQFELQPNVTNQQIGQSALFTKLGWEHVWTYNRKRIVNGGLGKETLTEPVQVNVEQVYPQIDFKTLPYFKEVPYFAIRQ